MKTYIDCIPCFFKQAIDACKMLGMSDDSIKHVLDKIALRIPETELSSTPPEMAAVIHRIIREETKNNDPYKTQKEKSNEIASSFYPELQRIVKKSKNRLFKAVEIAIAGNIIDYGAITNLDISSEIKAILTAEEKKIKQETGSIFMFDAFSKALSKSKKLLYLGDNAGEVYFDKILLSEIKDTYPDISIQYAVRGYPIINDATISDIEGTGIDEFAKVFHNGTDTPGTVLSSCSNDFISVWNSCDMVISKGQGNFESLSGTEKPIFYLFLAKCPVVAADIGCGIREVILLVE